LLSSLVESGKELIDFLTKKIHDQAKKEMQWNHKHIFN
jgi:hypothetical protein